MAVDEGTATLQRLRGQTLVVPDLEQLFAQLEQGTNPHRARLTEAINSELDGLGLDPDYIERVKSIDVALFTSRCFPHAEWPWLRVVGIFLLWLFCWDDEIDQKMEPDSSSYASDWAKACEYRSQSIMFVEEQLGVRPVKVTKAPTVVCSLFKDVATTLLQAPRQVNIGRLAQDLRFFMESNGVEQHLRLSGKLPTFQEYWSFRHGTGAVDSICTFALYMLNTTLPDTLCWVPEVMIMRRETSKQSILWNDLLSLKKEIRDMTPISSIPVLIHEHALSLEKTVRMVVEEMHLSLEEFQRAVESFKIKSREVGYTDVDEFISIFETFQTGQFRWTAESPRFGVQKFLAKDGTYLIPL